jgi:sulfide:quinone oxidoreductase
MSFSTPQSRLRVLIVGGGVAGIECLLGLHELAGDRVDVTILSERRDLVEGAVALGEPFGGAPAQRVDLAHLATETGAWFVHGILANVDADAHTVTTLEGASLPYDVLVVAVGAAPRLPWGRALALDVTTPQMLRRLRREAGKASVRRIVVALPPGPHWPLPGYELALMLARDERPTKLEIDLVTPERTPLQVFGPVVSESVAAQLEQVGVRLHAEQTMALAKGDPIAVRLTPGAECFDADLVVAVPDLLPHTLRGLPIDGRGFLPVDGHGRVSGAQDIYAAGDCAAFPIKQGGLAAQQADAVALHVAARAGVAVEAKTTNVVLRARMLTGLDDGFWMRRDLLRAGDRGEVSGHSLWWPPGKVAGRWLSPYLEARREAAAGYPHPVAHGRPIAPPSDPAPVPVPWGLDLLGDPDESHHDGP